MLNFLRSFLVVALLGCGLGCNQPPQTARTARQAMPSPFNVDSAMAYTAIQVGFGPRVPGTPAHDACARYLLGKLSQLGFKAFFQTGEVTTYDGKTFALKNIIGSMNPEKTQRVLLSAHWDTRPFSDEDSLKVNRTKTFDGANDGASGVGILLEIGRQLQLKKPNLGVDLIFWDLEDYGMKNDGEKELTWCLGSRYWASHPPVKGYNPLYNINLDMVGGIGAVFYREKASMTNDAGLVKKIWDIGNELGHSSVFSYTKLSNPIIDDHVVVNDQTGIPAIDIIDYNDKNGFYPYWHRQGDNLSHLDKPVMTAVGETVLEAMYREAENNQTVH